MIKLFTSRAFTNVVHFILDELVPPILRDTKWFMHPFFYLAYKGKNVNKYMEFKANYYSINNRTLETWYQNYDTIGTDRKTDLNRKSLNYILSSIDGKCTSLLDVACGRGYFLENIKEKKITLIGADLFEKMELKNAEYVKANVEALPFDDNSFDVVVSSHTLEHVIDIKKGVSELKRVARKQLIITVPRQRNNYYTLDLHLHFFPRKEILINLIGLHKFTCKKKGGDWVYIGYL